MHRTHKDILKDAGDAATLADILEVPSEHTVIAWGQRGSIPAKHWSRLSALGLASLDELAFAAAQRGENDVAHSTKRKPRKARRLRLKA